MTEEQQKHLDMILSEADLLIATKYKRGCKEYKTHLRDDYLVEELLANAIDEAVDQMVYLLTLKEKMGF